MWNAIVSFYTATAIVVSQLLELKFVKAVLTFIITSLSFLIWSFDITLQAMLIAIVMDFILWLWYAIFHGQFCKYKFKQWLEKEMIFACALILGHAADLLVFHQEMEFWIQNLIIVYIGINEIISWLRHLGKMWWKWAQKIIERIEWIPDQILINKK